MICKDCREQEVSTGGLVEMAICTSCYDVRCDRIRAEIRAMEEAGKNLDELLDEVRWGMLEMGMVREAVERRLDQVRVAVVLGVPFESLAHQ